MKKQKMCEQSSPEELNRHPQSTDEISDELQQEIETENTEIVEALPESEINSGGEADQMPKQVEHDSENEATSESEDLSPQSKADEEFMETIQEKKLTPAQAQKKKQEYLKEIEKAKQRMDEITLIAELSNNNGFAELINEIKSAIHNEVDEEEIKKSKDGLKIFEAVLLTQGAINRFRFEYNNKKSAISDFERRIADLKINQLSLLDGEKEDESIEALDSSIENAIAPTQVDKMKASA